MEVTSPRVDFEGWNFRSWILGGKGEREEEGLVVVFFVCGGEVIR